MRSTVMTVGIALLVSLTLGSSVIASGATSFEEPTAAQTGTAITLIEGDSGLVLTDEGTISIDDQDRGIGLNPNARFTFGDVTDPTGEHAFAVRASSETRDELLVRYVDASGNAVENVQLTFFSSSGSEVGRIGFDGRETTLALDRSPTTIFVVMTIDTTGIAPGEQVPGRLTFTV